MNINIFLVIDIEKTTEEIIVIVRIIGKDRQTFIMGENIK